MIAQPPRTGIACHRISIDLEVAGCLVALAIDETAQEASESVEAARLAEDLVATRIGCDRRLVRVATLMPSGRPVAMVRGRLDAISVSVSHTGGTIGAAVCEMAAVGLDIVDPAEAGPSLESWFTPDELASFPNEDGLLRSRLWGAKESAFKAARLDDRFRPRSVAIEDLGPVSFRWSIRGTHAHPRGLGMFTRAGKHLVAVAVAPDHRVAAGCRAASLWEAAPCS
ncbi:MAG: 4'-phosphopantetheinyl transferase family protein [Planctomycetia bacterium]